jgi:hypothetical protein
MDKFQALNKLSREVYQNAVDHGFYEAEQEMVNTAGRDISKHEILQHLVFGQRVALIHSELSEALEADRMNRFASLASFNSKRQVTPRTGVDPFKDKFETHIKDTVEDKIADALIRILDLCAANNIDIGTHVRLKMAYNAMRPKMHGKKY